MNIKKLIVTALHIALLQGLSVHGSMTQRTVTSHVTHGMNSVATGARMISNGPHDLSPQNFAQQGIRLPNEKLWEDILEDPGFRSDSQTSNYWQYALPAAGIGVAGGVTLYKYRQLQKAREEASGRNLDTETPMRLQEQISPAPINAGVSVHHPTQVPPITHIAHNSWKKACALGSAAAGAIGFGLYRMQGRTQSDHAAQTTQTTDAQNQAQTSAHGAMGHVNHGAIGAESVRGYRSRQQSATTPRTPNRGAMYARPADQASNDFGRMTTFSDETHEAQSSMRTTPTHSSRAYQTPQNGHTREEYAAAVGQGLAAMPHTPRVGTTRPDTESYRSNPLGWSAQEEPAAELGIFSPRSGRTTARTPNSSRTPTRTRSAHLARTFQLNFNNEGHDSDADSRPQTYRSVRSQQYGMDSQVSAQPAVAIISQPAPDVRHAAITEKKSQPKAGRVKTQDQNDDSRTSQFIQNLKKGVLGTSDAIRSEKGTIDQRKKALLDAMQKNDPTCKLYFSSFEYGGYQQRVTIRQYEELLNAMIDRYNRSVAELRKDPKCVLQYISKIERPL